MFKNTIAGGQKTAHSVRMFRQVLKNALLVGLILMGARWGYMGYKFEKRIYWKSIQVGYQSIFWPGNKVVQFDGAFWENLTDSTSAIHANIYQRSIGEFRAAFHEKLSRLVRDILNQLPYEGMLFLSLSGFIFGFFSWRGAKVHRKKHVSGTKLKSAFWLGIWLRITGRASYIRVGWFPFVKKSESRHFLITGTTGTGKTTLIHHFLQSIRKQDQKAVIIDTTGIVVEKYFDPEKDILLNPVDRRRKNWLPWVECQSEHDYKSLVDSLIPDSGDQHDKYWKGAARQLLLYSLLKNRENRDIEETIVKLLQYSDSDLQKFLAKTPASVHLNAPGQAAGVRGNLEIAIDNLKYLENTENPFSIRNWIEDENKEGWLRVICVG